MRVIVSTAALRVTVWPPCSALGRLHEAATSASRMHHAASGRYITPCAPIQHQPLSRINLPPRRSTATGAPQTAANPGPLPREAAYISRACSPAPCKEYCGCKQPHKGAAEAQKATHLSTVPHDLMRSGPRPVLLQESPAICYKRLQAIDFQSLETSHGQAPTLQMASLYW